MKTVIVYTIWAGCLVNNAGVVVGKAFLDHTREDYEAVMNVNVRSAIELCQVGL